MVGNRGVPTGTPPRPQKKGQMKKFISLFLAIDLLINPMMVRAAFAEEITPTEIPIVEQTEQIESTPPTDPTPTEAPASEISTGDAQAESQTDTTANVNIAPLPGEITTPGGSCIPPEGQTTCPKDVEIKTDNLAGVETQTDAIATTGDNQITDSAGDAAISTGDATASGLINNDLNHNEVILEPASQPIVSPSPEPTVTVTEEPKILTVENDNNGQVENSAEIIASTGDNLVSENLGDAAIQTGDATATANLLNTLNLNIVGSNFQILMLDLKDGQSGNIDLNELWKQLLLQAGDNQLQLADGSSNNLSIVVANDNQANLENNIEVTASTGNNQTNNNNNGDIQTGDAKALANVTNIVNTNLLGSKFFLGIINIFNLQTGDLILPRLENFALSDGTGNAGSAVFSNNNSASVTDTVQTNANTGYDSQSGNKGDNSIQTGNATAQSNDFTLANLNVQKNNWFFLMVNRLGSWTGQIIGWTTSSSSESQIQPSQIYQFGLNPSSSIVDNSSNEESNLTFQNENKAKVTNNIQTTADTGNNSAGNNQGDSNIQTGNALAAANVLNLINLNILGGHWFMGVVNVLNDWTGNIVFAYPDLTVGISDGIEGIKPGDNFEYTINYNNQGQDQAQGVNVELDLPNGVNYLSDTSGATPIISGQHLVWSLGNLIPGGQKSFKVTVQLRSDFTGNSLSFLEKILPVAYAAENNVSIVAQASIKTTDPESNVNNNQSSDTTIVNFPTQESSGGVDSRQPVLEISAKNNVNNFVYKGDTVTFDITIKNTSDVPSYNTHLIQKLYNGAPEDFGTFEFDLGTIEPGKGGTLTFGLKLADDGKIPADNYRTIARVYGKAPNGNDVSSNEARTDFKLIEKLATTFFEAKAAEKADVLGNSTLNCPPKEDDILPYVLLFLMSSLYITTRKYGQKI